uniref:Dihydrouridine synthase 4 like n=1 Tax=Sarcophilus harrisii TaxID=9305 RepID=A0A7N4P584_SARHA
DVKPPWPRPVTHKPRARGLGLRLAQVLRVRGSRDSPGCGERKLVTCGLAFRTLVRKYNCDLCYTPMIVAADFVRSIKARDSEFTTNKGDCPLIVQFAANDAQLLSDAARIVYPYANGIDINCGCPQR